MTQHVVLAHELIEGDRIFLKDLRILTVQGRPRIEEGEVIVKYHELAAKNYDGSIAIPVDKRVTTLCKKEGWCTIDQELDSLI